MKKKKIKNQKENQKCKKFYQNMIKIKLDKKEKQKKIKKMIES